MVHPSRELMDSGPKRCEKVDEMKAGYFVIDICKRSYYHQLLLFNLYLFILCCPVNEDCPDSEVLSCFSYLFAPSLFMIFGYKSFMKPYLI